MDFDPFGDPFRLKGPDDGGDDIFTTRPHFTGARATRKNDNAGSDAWELADEPFAEEIPVEAPPEKAMLRNLKWEAETVGFNEETPVSVEVQLPEVHKNKKRVLFELYAHTPAGPERISQAEGFIEEGGSKAIARIPIYQPCYFNEAGEYLTKVDYYFTAKHSQSDLLKDDKVIKTVEGKADRVIESHVLEDATFDTDRAFPHPRNAQVLEALVDRIATWKKKYSEGTIAIFGHTDAMGKEEYNKGLSERRAKAVHAVFIKDPAVLETLYDKEKWGTKAVQELLRHLGHDPGAIDGVDGPKTQGAMKAFQEKNGLAVDGKNSAASREGLFKAYIAGLNNQSFPKKLFEDMAGRSFQGCSEFNLLEKSDGALEKNRRVTVLLLRNTKKFLINYPCRSENVMACRAQVKKTPDKRRKAVYTCCFYDELVKEEGGGGGEVVRPTGVAKFIGIAAAEIKQYVNLDPDPDRPEAGMDRRLDVEVAGLAEGADVHWTVKAGPRNSPRTEPKTGPMLDADAEPLAFKDGCAALTSKVVQGKSAIWIRCGVCGGDEFTVEVGAVSGKADGSVKIVTWRRLEYETLHPMATGEGRLTDWTVFAPDKGPGLPRKSTDYLDKILGQGFVEFKEIHKNIFQATDLPDNGKFNVLDASYVGKTKGTKFLAVTPDQLGDVLDKQAKHRANKRSVAMIWCDYLAETTLWDEKYIQVYREDARVPSNSVFERCIGSSAMRRHGDFAIKSLRWTVSHWFDPSAPEGSRWKPVANLGDPGFAHREGGTFTEEADIKAHIQFEKLRKIVFTFPSTKDAYPGKLLKRDAAGQFTDKGKVLGLSLRVIGGASVTNFNGMAVNGKIWMNTFAGEVNHVGMAGVIAHELGHNMGQAYADKNTDATFGRPNDKPIPGIPFPIAVPEGDVYGDHGHRGTHCAKGVTDKAKDYTDKTSNAFKEHTCVMFGASDMRDSKEFTFCEDCLKYIRAEELKDIQKSWRS